MNGLTGYGWVDYFELLDVSVSCFFRTVDALILECRLGVLIKFSVDEPLSLSVFAKVDAILLSASLSSYWVSFKISLYGLSPLIILFDFH